MEPSTPVVSSPILITRITDPYQGRYSEEHLDDCREQYSEAIIEQPPPLYLNLFDSVEDLKTSNYHTNILHKETHSTSSLQEEGCCFSFGLFLDWIWEYCFCCCHCFVFTPADTLTPLRRF